MMPQELFRIGYLDRFTGLVEDEFSKFSNWGNLAEAEYEALAIPQHRIEYFKYRGFKVWDKKSRLDLVFGSAGDNGGKSIEDIMNELDDNKDDQDAIEDDLDITDSEDEDNFNVNIREIDTDVQAISRIPEEERSTHFIAIRISNPQIIRAAKSVQEDIVEREEALSDCCMGLGLFHVTICMLKLDGEQGSEEMIQVFKEAQPQLQELSRNLKLRVKGLSTFGQRVLYAKVLPDPDESFWQFVSLLNGCISRTSDKVNLTNKFELTPHMTLIKVNRPIARLRKSKYLPSALYEDHNFDDFGIQEVDNLQLCVIEDTTRADGFYTTLTHLSFS
jgi:2'-5' RNA ligase